MTAMRNRRRLARRKGLELEVPGEIEGTGMEEVETVGENRDEEEDDQQEQSGEESD